MPKGGCLSYQQLIKIFTKSVPAQLNHCSRSRSCIKTIWGKWVSGRECNIFLWCVSGYLQAVRWLVKTIFLFCTSRTMSWLQNFPWIFFPSVKILNWMFLYLKLSICSSAFLCVSLYQQLQDLRGIWSGHSTPLRFSFSICEVQKIKLCCLMVVQELKNVCQALWDHRLFCYAL